MLWYCLKKLKSKNQRFLNANKKTMLLLKCAVRDSKKPRFMKEQDTSGLLNNLELKRPLSKIPILGDNLF